MRLLTLLLLVALPGVVMIFVQTEARREAALQVIRSQAESVTAQSVYNQQQIISHTHRYLQRLAEADAIQNPSDPSCSAYVADILKLSQTYANIGVPRIDGELLCNALPLNKRVNVSDRGYFQRTINTRSFAIGEFQVDRAANQVSVNFSYPVISQTGGLRGAVVAVVSLEWWSTRLAQADLPAGAVAYISDAEGSVVANFPVQLEMLGRSDQLYGFGESNGLEPVIGADGVTRILSTTELYRTPAGRSVHMTIGIPVGGAIEAVNKQFHFTLLLFLLMMAGGLGLAVAGLRRSVLDPLDHLTTATDQLSHGELLDINRDHASSELIRLQDRFHEMAVTRLTAEQKAVQRSEELNSVFSALPDLYFRLNRDGLVVDHRVGDDENSPLSHELLQRASLLSMLPEVEMQQLKSAIIESEQHQQVVSWEVCLDHEQERVVYEARLNVIRSTDQFILVLRDITEQRQHEEKLQLSALVFRSISESIMVTDANGVILDVNPAFTQVTGYEFEEVLGQRPSILHSGEQDLAFYQLFWESLEQTGRWQGEIVNRRKNGESYPQWMTINTVYDDNSLPYRRVAMFMDITEQKNTEALIWRQAYLDQLTGLPNRKLLADRIEQELRHSKRTGLPTAILFLDLDQFKEVNDTLGHDVGDALLVQAAERISSCLRSVDTVARQGGDEFTIILSQIKNTHVVDSICDKILQEVSKPYQLGEHLSYITCSIGITFYPDDGNDPESLLKGADQAMYVAKNQGRNCYHYFTPEMHVAAMQRMQMVRDLRIAISERQFLLHYQPIICMDDRSICKAEALIRWEHPERGMVAPMEFIPVAEETRLITAIGNWVLDEAARVVERWQRDYSERFQISINISPIQFECLDSNIESWLQQLKQQGLAGRSLVAEITEGVMMNPSPETRQKLLAFKDAGVQVALDDFGTGYSSLAYISEYDIDFLKIDQHFVRKLLHTAESYDLCKAIIDMAHNLGIKVIAEGIETEEQHSMLKEMGCDYGQGYLYSKPLTIADFEQAMNRSCCL